MEIEKRKNFIINALYMAIIAGIVYAIIKYGVGLVAPFILGLIVAYALRRPTLFLAKKTKIPYKLLALFLVLIFYSTIGVVIGLVCIKIVTQTAIIISALPGVYSDSIEPALGGFFTQIEHMIYKMDPALVSTISDMFRQFVQSIGQLVTDLSVKIVGAISGYASSLPGFFIKLLLMIISTFFIAMDYGLIMGFAQRQLNEKTVKLILSIKQYIVGTIFVCIRSYGIIMTITFIELSIGLSIIGINNSILVALSIAIFDILPVLGTGGIMIPWVVIMAVQGNYSLAIGLLIVYVAITVIRNIIEPKIVGAQIGLHPVVTLVCIFVGAQLLGVIGMFGLPITVSLLKHLNDTGQIKIFK